MNILLWVLQVLLAVAFLAHGWLLLSPPAELAAMMNAQLPRAFWVFLGIAEVLASIGLTLPGITRVMPALVVWAAVGVAFVMVSATIWHIARREITSAFITLMLLAMAVVVAYMRQRVLPIRARA